MKLLKFLFNLIFLFFCSSAICVSYAAPRFPASIIKPEKISSSTISKSKNDLYKTKYFTQILDHFNYNPESYHKFEQRYLINDTYWGGAKKNSPIFVYTGNEGDIEWFTQNTGFMFDIAPRFEALLVFIEHRFYGKSIPYGGDKEVAYANASTLGYLSSTQALADYATIIIDLKKNLTATDSPVVVFGGSYGGMLAAWFRLKYPHVTIGALASSAPILNFENITSPYSFNNIVTQDFRSESENCYQVIKGSWQKIEDTANQRGGLDLLEKSFHICKNAIGANLLSNWLNTALVYTAMTDYPTPSNFLSPMPAYPVKQMCKAIDNPEHGNDSFAKLYAAASIYYNYTGHAKCFDLEDNSDPHGLDEWSWQACTEMVMPTGGSNEDSIFPVSESSYNDWAESCHDYYKVWPRPNWITTEFGGHDIKKVLKRFGSNIIFFNGLRDPWSGGGVLEDISTSIIAIVAKEGAHHIDLSHDFWEAVHAGCPCAATVVLLSATVTAKVMAELKDTCECRLPVVTKTLWFGADAGRMFIRCAAYDCSYNQWIDPHLGERDCEAIAERVRDKNKWHDYYMQKMSCLYEWETALRKKFTEKLQALLEKVGSVEECDGIEDVA